MVMYMKKRRKRRLKKKLLPTILLFIIIVLIVITLIIIKMNDNFNRNEIAKNKLKVLLIDNLNVEINSEIKLLSFIKKVEHGQIVSKDEKVDTSKLGKKELIIKIKEEEKIEDYKFVVNIVDTISPVIVAKDEINVTVGNKIDLLDKVEVSDNSNENLEVKMLGEYNFNKVGNYNLKYYVEDSSGNNTKHEFTLKVVSDLNNRNFTTSKGFDASVVNGVTYIDGVLVVNKTYSIPSTYGKGLTNDTQEAFNNMNIDSKKLGLNLWIASGYRSYYDQKYIYDNYVSFDGQKNADTYSARAGHSEHQTGLAFDLNTIDVSFANTIEGKWVNENCYKYGFIIRYPYGKDDITGYMYEPWHLRYVGVELATKLYNNGNWITIEEHFGIDSKYK